MNERYPLTSSEQSYLKSIYKLTRNGQPTSTVVLADALSIRPASVTNMLQKLAKKNPELVTYQKHYGILLTFEGEKAALQIIRRHRLIEQFLYQILNYPLDKIHSEAEELEHVVSTFFIDQIAQLLNNPAFDPHGDPIPNEKLILNDNRALVDLSELKSEERGIVRYITDQNSDLLFFLDSIGIFPEAEIKVIQVNPIDGALLIHLDDNLEPRVLGKSISDQIKVELKPNL